MSTVFLPSYTMEKNACEQFKNIIGFGKNVGIIYGEKAWQASSEKVLSGCKDAKMNIVMQALYGHEATYENVEKIVEQAKAIKLDCLIGVGGGKCLDTVKVAADILGIPVYTVATIASTCAAATKISIMYDQNGSFKDIRSLSFPARHVFIDPDIIINAPKKYLWAGIGDTMAKHVESKFSAKNDELDYASELGIKIGENCFYPLLRDGKQALVDYDLHLISSAFVRTILNILITTACVSVSVDPSYNSACAHALFYGLTLRPHIEKNHLHGEVVAYGTLVQLMLDAQDELLRLAYDFNKSVGLPTRLADLELNINDDLSDILIAAQNNKELEHVPYLVNAEMIYEAMKKLEEYNGGNDR